MRIIRVAAVLLVLYAGLLLTRAIQIWGDPGSVTLVIVGAVSLPLAFGLWKGTGWARWGTLVVLLLMIGQLAIFTFMLAVTSGGREVLQAVFTRPSLALAASVLDFVIVILLLLPSGHSAAHPGAAAGQAHIA
jgi:hypothetical protein